MKKICMLLIGGFFLVVCAFPQTPDAVFSGPGMMFFQKGTAEPAGKIGVSSYNYVYTTTIGEKELVKGAPYSATAVTESTQMLADGNRIVNKSTAFLARDGEGRTRREMTMGISSLPGGLPKMVTISDPVSKTETLLNEREQTARVMKGDHGKNVFIQQWGTKGLEQKGGAEGSVLEADRKRIEADHRVVEEEHRVMAANQADTAAKLKLKVEAQGLAVQARDLQGEVKHEDLGSQVIEGIACTGTRETRTIPAGAIGNERPLEITSETWKSADLHLIVLSKHNDPRFGETVYKLTDVKRDEPDSVLFQVPSNYKVIENGSPLLKP